MNPTLPRPRQAIGGGWIVLRRGRRSRRIRPGLTAFEHPSMEAACAEATRLAGLNPGRRFEVWCRAWSAPVETDAMSEAEFHAFAEGEDAA